MSDGLTFQQLRALQFIWSHKDQHGFTPSYAEIADYLGVKSKSNIHDLLIRLQESGYVRHEKGRRRSITLLKEPPQTNLLSTVTLSPEVLALTDKYAARHNIKRDTAVNELLGDLLRAEAA